ncbi:MAG: hypothetical protein ACXABY_19510 [Candidatus Thorarchaeota archaeon]|jgi:hypothetical protein
MSLEKDIQDAIDKQLPTQISDRLQERFKELEKAERELKKATKTIESLQEEEEEQRQEKLKYKDEVEKLTKQLGGWEARESEVAYREEQAQQKEVGQRADELQVRNDMLIASLNQVERLAAIAFKNPNFKFERETTIQTNGQNRNENGYMEQCKDETITTTETKTMKEDYDNNE